MEPSPATSPPWPPYPSPWRSTGRCHSCLCSMWDSLVPRQTSLFPNPDYLSLLRGLTPPTSTSRFTQPQDTPPPPLHQAINHGVHRLSLSLLHTADHVSWTSHHFCDTLVRTQARPNSQAVLLMDILRAIWDHLFFLPDTLLVSHIPDPALVKSLRSPPSSFSREVTE